MRTKTLLIAAATALAAGIISSQAQVYSQNIVGYVNQVVPGNGAQSLVQNPLLGTTNGAEQMLALQGGETLLLWSGSGYYVYQYQAGAVANDGAPTDWTDGGGVPIPGGVYNSGFGFTFVPNPQLAPGTGFFIVNPNGPETNTYVGSVILNSTNTLAGNGAQSMIGSALPIAANVETNTTLNLPLQGGETILVWAGSGYYVYQYQAGAVANDGAPTDWTDGGGVAIPGGVYNSGFGFTFVAAPVLTVGQAVFYVNPNTSTNWIQNLSVQ
jgi:hypothetical protein